MSVFWATCETLIGTKETNLPFWWLCDIQTWPEWFIDEEQWYTLDTDVILTSEIEILKEIARTNTYHREHENISEN